MAPRLGDIIEDHCGRCTRLTDHSIVATVGETVAKVRCRTCQHEHPYRHGRGGRKKAPDKKSAFDEVLAGILASQPSQPAPSQTAKPKGQSRPRRRKG